MRIFFLIFTLFVVSSRSAFAPDVRWTCAPDAVSIFVRTEDPFVGLLKPTGDVEDRCIVRGSGTNFAALKLQLKHGFCGVNYDSVEDIFWVAMDIRAHPVLIVDQDQLVNITCRGKGNSTVRKHTSEYRLELLESGKVTSHVRYSAPYALHVVSSTNTNFTVGKCLAAAGSNYSVQLTDSRGCSILPSLISNFERGQNGFLARLPSMFRFPSFQVMQMTCRINECDEHCEEIDCSKEDSSLALLESSTTGTDMDDTGLDISVQLTVEEKMEHQSRRNIVTAESPLEDSSDTGQTVGQVTDLQCPRPADVDMLYALCILLTVSSTIGFTLNICFCCSYFRRKKATKQEAQNANIPTGRPDFWIMDSKTGCPIDQERRLSASSYASVKKLRRPPLPIDYGMATSRNSDSSSGYGGDIYRRPEICPSVRHSNSTFMSPSITMETDLDDSFSSSNQITSYH